MIITSRSIKLVILSVTLVGAAFAMLFSVSIFAHNKSLIQWNPEGVNETLTFGEIRVIPVTLTADKNLPKTIVRVSPEITPYVSISPISIGKIQKGATVTLTLTVRIPANAPLSTTSGAIELYKAKQENTPDGRDDDDDDNGSRDSTGKKEKSIGKPLPVTIQISVEKLPPDPGEAGKAALGGIDFDGDGVRDDVQRYIVLTVPESARHREALKNVARVTQRELLAQSKEEAIQAAIAGVRSIECLGYLGVVHQKRWKEVEALILNTEARLRAMDVHNDRISGQIFPLLPDNLERTACTFNVEVLPN